jgi:hypothetical protein
MLNITSSASKDLPLWNSIPLRNLKTHIFASGDTSHEAASSGIGFESTSISTKLFMVCQQTSRGILLVMVIGSSESVVNPPEVPILNRPPFLGVAAFADLGISQGDNVTVNPKAAILEIKTRREIFPLVYNFSSKSFSVMTNPPYLFFAFLFSLREMLL